MPPGTTGAVRRVVLPAPAGQTVDAPHVSSAPVTPARPTLSPLQANVAPNAGPAVEPAAGPAAAGRASAYGAAASAPAQPQRTTTRRSAYQPESVRPSPPQPQQPAPQPSPQAYQPRVGPADVPDIAASWQPDGRIQSVPVVVPPSFSAPTATPSAPAAPSLPAVPAVPAVPAATDGVRGVRQGQTAFVPAGIRPVVGQSFGTVEATPAAEVTAPVFGSVSTGPTQTIGVDEAEALPRWGTIASSGQGWKPVPTDSGPSGPSVPSSRPAATTDEDEEPDDAIEPPRHPYTWLHMIVLVLVAFVLGMLIFVVLLRDSGSGGAQGAGAVGDVVAWAQTAATAAGVAR